MNNKGFAITGILYTLFVLFMMILLSILSTISYKKGILEKTVLGLEDDFNLTEVTITEPNNPYQEKLNQRIAPVNGKYVFTQKTKIPDKKDEYGNIIYKDITNYCTIYLKKGNIIPTSISTNNENPDFTLIPNDCNEFAANIILDNPSSTEVNTLILTNVYEFKGSD